MAILSSISSFSKTTVGQSSSLQFTVFNTYTIPVTITVISSNAVFNSSILTWSIPPSGQKQMSVSFTPTNNVVFTGTISIINNYDANTVSVTETGEGIRPIIEIVGTLDFGRVSIKDEKTIKIKVLNNSSEANLIVSSITSGSADFTVTPTSFTVNPNSEKEVSVKAKSLTAHATTSIITIANNSSNSPSNVINDNAEFVIPQISIDTSLLDFGNVPVGTTSTKNFLITNTSIDNVRLLISSIVCDNNKFSISQTSISLNKNISVSILVSYTATDSSVQTGIITVYSNAPDEGFFTQVTGIIAPVISVPETFDLGMLAINTSITKELRIYNRGVIELHVSASITSDVFTIVGSTTLIVNPNSFEILVLKYSPIIPNVNSENLILTSDDPIYSVVNVNITGTSESPKISVDEGLIFGNVLVGQSSEKNITIRNSGVVPLIIESVVFNPTIYSTTATIPLTVNPNSSYSFPIKITPINVGSAYGSLTISSNDYNNGIVEVALKATAVVPDIFINPTNPDFGIISINSTKTMQIQITNRGEGNLIIESIVIDEPLIFSVEESSFVVYPNRSHIVNITATVTETGVKTGHITLETNDPDTTSIITATIQGEVPVIQVDSSPINFGLVALNELANRNLVISNSGLVDLTVGLSTESPFNVSPANLTVGPNESKTASVSFKSSTVASFVKNLGLSTNDPVALPISIVLSGNADAFPRASIAITSIDFGSVKIGQSKSRVLTINNIGQLPLNFSITSSNSAFSVSPTTGTANSPANVLVTFTPQATIEQETGSTTGSFSGTLTITTNDPVSSTTTVSVSGVSEMGTLKWREATITLPPEIEDVAEGMVQVLDGIVVVLDIISALLNVLKKFIIDLSDPLKIIIQGLITILENLKKSLTASGIYILPIIPIDPKSNPKDSPGTFAGMNKDELKIAFPNSTVNALDYLNSIKGGSQAFINRIVNSFDDIADSNRPQFSSDMVAGGIVFAVDSSEIISMIETVANLCRLFGIEFANQFTPPTNIQTISGNNTAKITFTGGEGLLTNAFLIWRSEISGGEFITEVDGVNKLYAMDEKGRLVKNYKLIAVKTLNELVAQAMKIPKQDAESMIDQANGYMNGLIAGMEQATAMKFYFDDETALNGKTYYYTVSSAFIDPDKSTTMKNAIGEYTNTILYKFDSLTPPIDNTGIGKKAGLKANGPMSTEMSCMPKSAFDADLTGEARCKNYRCSIDKEATETISYSEIELAPTNQRDFLENELITLVWVLKNKPVIGGSITITVKRKAGTGFTTFEFPRNKYTVELSTGRITFISPNLMDEGDEYTIKYKYRPVTNPETKYKQTDTLTNVVYDGTYHPLSKTEIIRESILVKARVGTVDTVITNYIIKEPEGNSIRINDFGAEGDIASSVKVSYEYMIKKEEIIFKCIDAEFNKFYFDVKECDRGNKLCPGYENRKCIFNDLEKCTNTNFSQRLKKSYNSVTGLWQGFQPENIPFSDFYDPIYCQNGIMAQRCDGYDKVAPRAGYKGEYPNWIKALPLDFVLQPLFALIDILEKYLKKLLNTVQKMTATILAFINLIQKKIDQLKAFILRIKAMIEMLRTIFDVGSVFLLNVPPATGGNEYLKTSIKTAINGPSSGTNGYTSGVVIAYGGPNSKEVAKALGVIFG